MTATETDKTDKHAAQKKEEREDITIAIKRQRMRPTKVEKMRKKESERKFSHYFPSYKGKKKKNFQRFITRQSNFRRLTD